MGRLGNKRKGKERKSNPRQGKESNTRKSIKGKAWKENKCKVINYNERK